MTTLRKICLLLGLLWLTYVGLGTIYDLLNQTDEKLVTMVGNAVGMPLLYGILPTYIFWKITGGIARRNTENS